MPVLRIIDDKDNILSHNRFGESFKHVLDRPLVGETLFYQNDKGKEIEYIVKKVLNRTNENNHEFVYILSKAIGEL